MKSFDQYEFAGILVPGVITLYGLSVFFPGVFGLVAESKISIGELGLFVVIAFAAGHMIQALGDLFETRFWRLKGGWPTDWVRTGIRPLLSAQQIQALEERVAILCPQTTAKPIAAYSERDWFGLTRQIYAKDEASGRTQRIDTFNANYGMLRGIAVGLVVCLAGNIFSESRSAHVSFGLGALVVLALYRMYKFGEHYAREMFVQFLNLDKDGVKAI